MTINRRYKVQDILFALSFAAIVIFLFWRVRYGFANKDECYYITVPYRFWQGDAMIIHEWSMVQLYTFLTLPLVSLHMALVGSTDGIVLSFRFAYVFLCAISAIYCYYCLKKFDNNGIGSKFAALTLLTYVPFGINSLSYNSMGILFLAMAFSSFVISSRSNKIFFILSGLFLAASVLCCPYLALLYFLYCFLVILLSAFRKGMPHNLINFKALIYITLGVCILAIPFLLYILLQATPLEIMRTIPYIFSDPSHASSASSKVFLFFYDLYRLYNCKRELALCVLLTFIAAFCKWRKWAYPSSLMMLICSICIIIAELKTYLNFHYINFLPLPLNFLVPAAYIIPDEKDSKRDALFWFFWVPALLYTFCLHLASNQNAYAIASASTVPLVGGIVIIGLSYKVFCQKDNNFFSFLTPKAIMIVLLVLVSFQLLLRYQNVFWDSDIHLQNVYLDQGPHKGTFVTEARSEEYLSAYHATQELEDLYHPTSACFVTNDAKTMYYLFGSVKTGAFSSILGLDISSEKIREYYTLFPEKIPDMLYFGNDIDDSYIEWLYQSANYVKVDFDLANVHIRKNIIEEN